MNKSALKSFTVKIKVLIWIIDNWKDFVSHKISTSTTHRIRTKLFLPKGLGYHPKAKCEVLYLGLRKFKICIKTWRRIHWEHPSGEGSWDSDELKAWREPIVGACSPEGQMFPGLDQKRNSQQGEESNYFPLHVRTHLVYYVQARGSQHKKDTELLVWVQRRTTKMEHLSHKERFRELGSFSFEKKRLWSLPMQSSST